MISCDLCGKTAPCVQKEIEGKEFDICESCWHPLEVKLSGKGRSKHTLDEVEEYEETTV
jgi:ribosome-binding protein aMBF1 (putative translation factor)